MQQPLEDRIPTAAEALAVDPAAAWNRLSHKEQAQLGSRLMRYIATSGALRFVRTSPPEKGWGDYTPEQIEQCLWSQDDYDAVERASEIAFDGLSDEMDKYFPQTFGWSGPTS